MKSIFLTVAMLGLGLVLGARVDKAADASALRRIVAGISGNGRDWLTLSLRNTTATMVEAWVPAGTIFRGGAGGAGDLRVIVLRAAAVKVEAGSALELSLPVAALSSTNGSLLKTSPAPGNLSPENALEAFVLTADTEPRLAGLLEALVDQPDAPRATVQLAIFALLEDVSFAQWRSFLRESASEPTPAEITQAIDALGLLKAVAPERVSALAGDADLKRRALRNPWSRVKAMAVYGLDLGDGAVPPDLRQLLHTQAGDNCPLCRQRGLLQNRADLP